MIIVLHQASKSLCYILLLLVGRCLYIRVSLSSLTKKPYIPGRGQDPVFWRGERNRCNVQFPFLTQFTKITFQYRGKPSILRATHKVIFSPKFKICFHFPKLDISISSETWALVHFLRKLSLGRGKGTGPFPVSTCCVYSQGAATQGSGRLKSGQSASLGMIATLPKIKKHIFLARNHGLRFLKAPLLPLQFKPSSFKVSILHLNGSLKRLSIVKAESFPQW